MAQPRPTAWPFLPERKAPPAGSLAARKPVLAVQVAKTQAAVSGQPCSGSENELIASGSCCCRWNPSGRSCCQNQTCCQTYRSCLSYPPNLNRKCRLCPSRMTRSRCRSCLSFRRNLPSCLSRRNCRLFRTSLSTHPSHLSRTKGCPCRFGCVVAYLFSVSVRARRRSIRWLTNRTSPPNRWSYWNCWSRKNRYCPWRRSRCPHRMSRWWNPIR
jgi:hypothetical protein